jgi:hypothetical protein
MHHFYSSALNFNLQPGQIMVIAGDVHTGKSFINKWLIGATVGGSVNATASLMKQTSFNKQAGEFGHWRVDDAPTDGNWQDKRRFTQALKEHAANPTLVYMPKFKDSTELPFLGRVCITLNLDPDSLALLPAMDGSFADKVMMFKIAENFDPHFFRTTQENESRIMGELPFFLRWLLDWGDKVGEQGGMKISTAVSTLFRGLAEAVRGYSYCSGIILLRDSPEHWRSF